MTVEYTSTVATGKRGLGNFWRLLFWWTGSIYKLVYPDLIAYMILYYFISAIYRIWISPLDANNHQKVYFHRLVYYAKEAGKFIPMQFVLGFYVSQVATRWWAMFMTLPWPDTIAVTVAASVRGHDERGRLMRRTILRYVNTSLIMTLVMISPVARSRFPTLDDLVDAGFLVPHERLIIENLNEKSPGPKNYVPIVWAAALVSRARKEGRIADGVSEYHIMQNLCTFRKMTIDLLSYDWLSIPMVYTQVATLATYVYFLSCLMSRQFIKDENRADIFVPVFLIMEFIFMLGWLKVAEIIINPFGKDDDDFEVNWLIDRNITVSYCIVDEINNEFPEMLHDAYWDIGIPEELMYTQESLKYKTDGMGGGSAAAKEGENKEHVPDEAGRQRRLTAAYATPIHSLFDLKLVKRVSGTGSNYDNNMLAQFFERKKVAPEYKESYEDIANRHESSIREFNSKTVVQLMKK